MCHCISNSSNCPQPILSCVVSAAFAKLAWFRMGWWRMRTGFLLTRTGRHMRNKLETLWSQKPRQQLQYFDSLTTSLVGIHHVRFICHTADGNTFTRHMQGAPYRPDSRSEPAWPSTQICGNCSCSLYTFPHVKMKSVS